MEKKTAAETTHSTTVRLNPEFYRRLKSKLAADGETFQSKVQALAAMLELADHQIDEAGYAQRLRDHAVPV
jgi:hypothetical protein